MTRIFRQPLTWILLTAAALRLAGLFWGLPGSDGWDDDGFAPRNFLTALALTWKHGGFFTYPPLHAILLAAPSLPVAAWALAHAPSLHPADVIATITRPEYMTYFMVVARLVNLAMSLGIIWCVGGMAALIGGPRAGLFAAGAATLNVALTYYGQVSNLDVPYLFWSAAALWAGMRAVALHKPREFWWAALLAACAIATKDQATALFALSVPAMLLLWFARDAWPRRNAGRVIVTLLAAAGVAVLALLLVDGALTNWPGFVARLHFLTGPASHDFAAYPADGGWRLLADMWDYYAEGYGLLALVLAVSGLALVVARLRGAVRVAALLPVLAILSFTLLFNLTALRSDVRFLLPQGVLACVYIGVGIGVLANARPGVRLAAQAAVAVVALLALHQALGVTAAMLNDPRYDAEAWMADNLKPGDTVATYGQNAYLPRFALRAWRIAPAAVKGRNPRADITERQAPFAATRARYIVVNDWWLRHYTDPRSELGGHRIPSPRQQSLYNDAAAHAWFSALRSGQAGYRIVHVAGPHTGAWPELHIHESLNESILIFERRS
jgi:hypothetical protein